jgi:predicted RecB family nuclease
MRILEGGWVFSPSDLTGFAACVHLTGLDRAVALGQVVRPERSDPLLDVLSRRGGEHEASMLVALGDEARSVVTIEPDTRTRAGLEAAAAATEQAMRAGVDVISQATFFRDGWVGHADFLERVDKPHSELGGWSYEVADAKLARTVKPAALVQVCAYAEQVEHIQGCPPTRVHVLTGDGVRHSFLLTSLAAYYRALRERFLAAVKDEAASTYPEPVEHCSICRWDAVCTKQRRSDDHLSLVAGMRRDQTRHLEVAAVPTRTALAVLNAGTVIDGIGAATLERLRAQAELQVRGDGVRPPLFELLEPEVPRDVGPERGFAALPEPSPGDLFLDLEGDPYALEGGLEYLFGIVELIDGKPVYHPFWGHTRAEEGQAFERAIDLIVDRYARDPNLHVYHYAPYEPTAIRRLMGTHGTRETEVDELLRGEVFVDLYQVVRQSVRLSTESYSLKQVETLYLEREANAVMDAGSSIVAYEDYLIDNDEQHLAEIADYNRDDCVSLVGLQHWLEARRRDAEAEYGPVPRPAYRDSAAGDDLAESQTDLAALVERLRAGVPETPEDRTPEQQARWLLGELVHWHRRQAKPAWWMYFHRVRDLDDQELADDSECIGGLTYEGVVGTEKSSEIHRYHFEPQDHKIAIGSSPHDPETQKAAGTVVFLDDAEGIIDLKRGIGRNVPHPRSLVPPGPLGDKVLQVAIAELTTWVTEHGMEGPGRFAAGRALLLGAPPRVQGSNKGAPLIATGESPLDATRRIAPLLDATCLALQGPPGSGKTFTGAHIIVDLLDAGKKVGVTALSHAAIGNLLREVCKVATKRGVEIRALQRASDDQHCGAATVERANDNERVEAAVQSGTVDLVAGTAWLWARPGMRDAVDVLVVDEAGQLSLANVLAVCGATTNLVLLGDPQQLAQPSQASHPQGAGASALEHLLGEHQTIPPELGIFLDATYRMHPNICEFISEIVYEGRLHPAEGEGLERQAVGGDAGLHFVAVEHQGNRTHSDEEAKGVAELITRLVGKQWCDADGNTRDLGLADVLVVTPYNAQVACLQRHLPQDARVGTVDKFQGQEAPVTIYSMATSTPDDAPRGMSFLYDLHRFNVAVSRAQAVSIVVASPALLNVLCTAASQVPLANALCRYAESASREEGFFVGP